MNVCADQPSETCPRPLGKKAGRSDGGKPATGNVASRRPSTGMSVDALLPADVLRQLRAAVEPEPRVTKKLVAELEARFDIERSYGISLNHLASFLRRSRKKWQCASSQAEPCVDVAAASQADVVQADNAPTSNPSADRVDATKLRAHRRRQASVASILEATFGRLAESDPTLWDRRAYQLLVGLVYERLACDKDELPTVELVALAKVLNESRRANNQTPSKGDAKRGSAGDEVTPRPAQTGKLPERFGDLIRQVYGATIDGIADEESAVASDSPTGESLKKKGGKTGGGAGG